MTDRIQALNSFTNSEKTFSNLVATSYGSDDLDRVARAPANGRQLLGRSPVGLGWCRGNRAKSLL